MKNPSLLILIVLNSGVIYPQEVRLIRDDVGYCWKADEFERFINWLDKNSAEEKFDTENLVAAISPHDDYLYAGEVYYPLYKLINAKEVVIFGVTHSTVRKEINDPKNVIILEEFDRWKGPYGDVEITPLRERIKQQLGHNNVLISDKAHTLEHSIEGLIPFLQHYNKHVKIVPIMVTAMTFDRMDSLSAELAKIILLYIEENNLELGKDIFFLFSNDANHYGEDFNNQPYGMNDQAHRVTTANDKRIVKQDITGVMSKEKLETLSNELWPEAGVRNDCPLWCGRYSVVFGLLTVNKVVNKSGKVLIGQLYKYSDTWTGGVLPVKGTSMGITAPYSLKHWVGFFSAGFYLK